MKICITVGHSILRNGSCTSAGGYVQEYAYCKELAPLIATKLRREGHTVDIIICPERQFKEAYEEKTYKLSRVNGKKYDLLIELHLNCYNGSAKGTEVLYYSERGKSYAQRVNDKLDDIFTDRDIKQRKDLYILKSTDCPAILIEAFFCDNKEDYMKADEYHEKDLIARKIAEGVLNKSIIENYAYGIKVYDFSTKESAIEFSNEMTIKESAYNYVDVNGSKWCVKIESFNSKENSLNFSTKIREKYNAYNEIYTV